MQEEEDQSAETCPQPLLDLLREQYPVVVPILEWLPTVGISLSPRSVNGLSGVVLCCDSAEPFQQFPAAQQGHPNATTHTAEITRFIEEVLFAKKLNLLAYGYRVSREGHDSGVGSVRSVSCFYPNANVTFMHGPAWRELHDKLGTGTAMTCECGFNA